MPCAMRAPSVASFRSCPRSRSHVGRVPSSPAASPQWRLSRKVRPQRLQSQETAGTVIGFACPIGEAAVHPCPLTNQAGTALATVVRIQIHASPAGAIHRPLTFVRLHGTRCSPCQRFAPMRIRSTNSEGRTHGPPSRGPRTPARAQPSIANAVCYLSHRRTQGQQESISLLRGTTYTADVGDRARRVVSTASSGSSDSSETTSCSGNSPSPSLSPALHRQTGQKTLTRDRGTTVAAHTHCATTAPPQSTACRWRPRTPPP